MEPTSVLTKILILSVFLGIAECTGDLKNGLSNDALMPDIDGRIVSMGNCSDDNDYWLLYKDVSIEKKSKNCYTLKAKLQTLKEMPAPVKITNKVDACGTMKKPKCEFFTNIVTVDACAELEQEKGQLYKMFKAVNMSHIRCPLPKKVYTLPPYEIKLPQEAKGLVAKSEYWEVESRMECGEEKKLCACLKIKLDIHTKEKERKRKGRETKENSKENKENSKENKEKSSKQTDKN